MKKEAWFKRLFMKVASVFVRFDIVKTKDDGTVTIEKIHPTYDDMTNYYRNLKR